jgi:predicted ArsR family transcriptional regulator
MDAPTLFDELGPHVRRSDPATSVAALDSLRRHLPAQRMAVLTVVANSDCGATAWDVVDRLDRIQRNVASRRLTDLAQAGLVVDTGTTRIGRTGRPEIVWRVTEAGRTVMAEVAA